MNADPEYIKATVKADSSIDSVEIKNGRYMIKTREPAENGRANAAIVRLLADHLKVDPHSLSIIRGTDRPSKIILKRNR